MRALAIGLILANLSCHALAQNGLRQVDFKNFSYPWAPYSEWPDHLAWQDASEQNHIQLADGRWRDASEGDNSRSFTGLTLEQVLYADVTGDGKDDAIVVLRFDTGGTQYSHYVYVYSLEASKPKLRAYFHSGDRAVSGLYRAYGRSGRLVVELFDPTRKMSDCCSEGFVRTRYQWRDDRFVPFGKSEKGKPTAASRMPVSVFGVHQ